MQEDEYEEMRKDYLRAELATMPPFSSFKSGNTIGRVVGETAPAAVPASRANPPIEAETEEEGITGEQILDGIQLGLDVVGLIPVFGEIADLANAGVSAARGDYVGAGLSLLSAIPFVGYAGTAGKATRYGTTMVEASGQAAKEATDKAAKEAADKAAVSYNRENLMLNASTCQTAYPKMSFFANFKSKKMRSIEWMLTRSLRTGKK